MGAQIFVLPSTPVLNGNLYGSYHIVYVKYEIVVLFLFISFFKGYLNLKKKRICVDRFRGHIFQWKGPHELWLSLK